MRVNTEDSMVRAMLDQFWEDVLSLDLDSRDGEDKFIEARSELSSKLRLHSLLMERFVYE